MQKTKGFQWATTPWSAPPWLWPSLWRRAKNKGTPNISQNQDFSGAPPTRFVKKRVGGVMVMLNFFACLEGWKLLPSSAGLMRAPRTGRDSKFFRPIEKTGHPIGCPDLLWSGLRGSNSLPGIPRIAFRNSQEPYLTSD